MVDSFRSILITSVRRAISDKFLPIGASHSLMVITCYNIVVYDIAYNDSM